MLTDRGGSLLCLVASILLISAPGCANLEIETKSSASSFEVEASKLVSTLARCSGDAGRHACFGSETGRMGEQYVGEFLQGRFHGNGVYRHANGAVYVGEFQSGERHGVGVNTWPGGQRYIGEFRNGKQEGFGFYIWPDGGMYVGHWRNDRRKGAGVVYNASGSRVAMGWWDNDLQTYATRLSEDSFPFSTDPKKVILERRQSETQAAEQAKRLAESRARDEAATVARKQIEQRLRLRLSRTSALGWREHLLQAVNGELIDWLEQGGEGLDEIPPPSFPSALSLKQETWETNKEFDLRVEKARTDRRQIINTLQAEYRTKVEDRNKRVAAYNIARQGRGSWASAKKERVDPSRYQSFIAGNQAS